ESASGHLYVATDDFAVLKYESCIARKPHTPRKKKHLTRYPMHSHYSQTYKQNSGKYMLNTSFYQASQIEHDSKKGTSNLYTDLRYLTSTNYITSNVVPIERPIIQLTNGPKVKPDMHFWENHNYVPDPGKSFSFYCSDAGVFTK
ncbi:MAG: hypothetical protein RLO12_05305, partial [Fulvivirga sp.]